MAEAYLVGQHFRPVRQSYVVEPGQLRRPKRRLGLQAELRAALRVGGKLPFHLQSVDAQGHLLACNRPAKLHVALQFVVSACRKFKPVIVYLHFGRFNKKHVAGYSAVVPPVRIYRRHILRPALVVPPDHNEVATSLHLVGDVEIERRKTSLVYA